MRSWLLQFGIREAAGLGPSLEPVARYSRPGWTPRIDLFQHDAFLLLRIELPGVPPRSVALTLDPAEGTLTVRGERSMPPLPGGRASAMRLEIDYGPFEREIELPSANILVQDVQAELADGMLSILLPLRYEPLEALVRPLKIRVRTQ